MGTLGSHGSYEGCLYGDEDTRNRTAFEYHSFCIVVIVSVAMVLFNHAQLNRMYYPLARLVDAAIALRFFDSLAYFSWYPYAEGQGNCTEIYLSRMENAVVSFGEIHQLYLLANLLGLGTKEFVLCGKSFTIPALLKTVTFVLFFTIAYSLVMRKFKIVRNLWVIFTCVLQLYVVGLSKRTNEMVLVNKVIDSSDRAVVIYRKLTIMQIFPSIVCLVKRILSWYGVFGNIGTIPQCLDEVCNLLFFIKSLLIAENSNVTVEVL